MKKIAFFFAALMTAFSFASCDKEVAPVQSEPVKQAIKFNITVGDLTPETKATKTGWVNGDKINIWFDGNFETNPDVVLTYNGTSWEAGDLREGCELTEGTGKNLVALYESQNDLGTYNPSKNTTLKRLLFSYDESQKVDGSDSKVVVSPASMMAGCSAAYSLSSDGILTSVLDNWGFKGPLNEAGTGVINGFQITVEGLPDNGEYALNCAAGDNIVVLKNMSLDYSSAGSSWSVKLVVVDKDFYVYSQASDNKAVFYFTQTNYDSDATDVSTTITLIPKKNGAFSSSNVLSYTVTIPSVKKAGAYQAFRINFNKFNETINNHEFVDLGLPSGLKWATCNVGATTPEEYGDYFAWGETAPKTAYSWGSYFDTTDGGTTFSKYASDKKTVLDPEDDAANVNWGGTWRMPTDEEWTELIKKCAWTKKASNGYLVTGPNGNTIFLPAAGYRDGTSLKDAGSYGDYWSSSLLSSPVALRIYLGGNDTSVGNRYLGFSVRPVSK